MYNNKKNIHDFGAYFGSIIPSNNLEDNKATFKGISILSKSINGNCVCCGKPLKKMNIDIHELFVICHTVSSDPDHILAMCKLKEDDINVYTVKFKKLEREWDRLKEERNGGVNNGKWSTGNYIRPSLLCPRCGSTNIKTEKRKYGLFDWFTNSSKVCHTCDECDYTWMEI